MAVNCLLTSWKYFQTPLSLASILLSPTPLHRDANNLRKQSKRQREFDIYFMRPDSSVFSCSNIIVTRYERERTRDWSYSCKHHSPMQPFEPVFWFRTNTVFSFKKREHGNVFKSFFPNTEQQTIVWVTECLFCFRVFFDLMSFWSASRPPFLLVSFLLVFFFDSWRLATQNRPEWTHCGGPERAMCFDA